MSDFNYPKFITPAEVDKILATVEPQITNNFVEINRSLRRCLEEDLYLDRDYPPFDTVRMDGIAITDEVTTIQPGHTWSIETSYFAGNLVQDIPPKACVEIMTGAIAPANASAVIPYEQVQINAHKATYIASTALSYKQNIHPQAKDGTKGQLILPKGTCLGPEHLQVLGSIGVRQIQVRELASIALLATGNELVTLNEMPTKGQLRASNLYSLETLLNQEGFPTQNYYLPDEPHLLETFLCQDTEDFPIIISTGGCSAGKTDYFPQVLAKIQARILCYKVRQRPGKPMLIAVLPNNRILFALPGNPISALICYYRYVLPFLRKHYKAQKVSERYAILQEDFSFAPELTYFLSVAYQPENLLAKPKPNQGSGDFLSIIQANGFVSLDAKQNYFPAGSKLAFFPFDNY